MTELIFSCAFSSSRESIAAGCSDNASFSLTCNVALSDCNACTCWRIVLTCASHSPADEGVFVGGATATFTSGVRSVILSETYDSRKLMIFGFHSG